MKDTLASCGQTLIFNDFTTIGRGIRALRLRIAGVDTLTADSAGAKFVVRFAASGTYRLDY